MTTPTAKEREYEDPISFANRVNSELRERADRADAENARLRVELERARTRIEKLEKLKDSRRWNAACAAMQGLISDCGGVGQHRMFMETVPEAAVEYADAILAAFSSPRPVPSGVVEALMKLARLDVPNVNYLANGHDEVARIARQALRELGESAVE